MIKCLIFVYVFFLSNICLSEERKVSFSFDPVPGANQYEIEIYLFDSNGPTFFNSYKTESPSWSGELETGVYQFRLRSLDYRKIPGEWSEFVKFNVSLPRPVIVRPLKDEIINSSSFDLEEVLFQWVPVRNVNYYHLVVKDSKQNVIFDEVIQTSQQFINLKVGEKFTWAVTSSDGNKVPHKDLEFDSMTILGAALESPDIKIDVTDTRFVVRWDTPNKASNFEYRMFKRKSDEEKWVKLAEKSDYKKDKIFFIREKLAHHQYRFEVIARSDGYANSPMSRIDFVWNGKSVKVIEKQKMQREKEDSAFSLRPHLYTVTLMPEFKKISYQNKVVQSDTLVENSLSSQFLNLNVNYEKKRSNLFYELNMKYGNYLTKNEGITQYDFSFLFSYNFKRLLFSFRIGTGLSYFTMPFVTGDAVARTFEYSSGTFFSPVLFISFNGKLVAKSAWGYSLHVLGRPFLYGTADDKNGQKELQDFYANMIAHLLLTNQISERFSLAVGVQVENYVISDEQHEQSLKSIAGKAGVSYSF